MTTINDGGPAFPTSVEHGINSGMPGMTLRDWFAGQALQGMLANQHQYKADDEAMFARDAYVLADSMLKARGVKA